MAEEPNWNTTTFNSRQLAGRTSMPDRHTPQHFARVPTTSVKRAAGCSQLLYSMAFAAIALLLLYVSFSAAQPAQQQQQQRRYLANGAPAQQAAAQPKQLQFSEANQQPASQASCADGYLVGSRQAHYWKYLEEGFPALADVSHAEGRLYVVFNLLIGTTKQTRRHVLKQDWSQANWTIRLPAATGMTSMHAPAQPLRGGGSVLTVFTPLPWALEQQQPAGSLLHVDISSHLTAGGMNYTKVWSAVPFCTYPRDMPFRHLTACTSILPESAHMVPEWVAWHELQGVEHFYVHSDGPADSVRGYLQPLIAAGLVTVVDSDFPLSSNRIFYSQLPAMNSCLMRARGRSRWVAFMDVDELFQPMAARGSPNGTVAGFLTTNSVLERVGVVRALSIFFWADRKGNNEQARRTVTGRPLQIVQYQNRKPIPVFGMRQKMLANPHGCTYLDVHTVKVGGETWKADPETELRLAHYKKPWMADVGATVPDSSLAAYAEDVFARLVSLNASWVSA